MKAKLITMKKYRAINCATNVIYQSDNGHDWNTAVEMAKYMNTRTLYKYLKDNGYVWSVAFENWKKAQS